MSTLNRKIAEKTTNSAGTPVAKISAEKQLARLALAHMLWEDQFYVDGVSNVDSLRAVVAKVDSELAVQTAVKARKQYKLRHVPLAIMRELARSRKLKATDLAEVINRPDEITEFISLYWRDGRQPLSSQVKKGLAQAFLKFNEYQLAKWDRNSAAVSLRDAMFLVHAKPETEAQADVFKRLANRELKTPDTWETNLSAGADKRETFTRLMQENKLGALAFLRNLRNMEQANVSRKLIESYSETVDCSQVLPFRFVAASRVVPSFKPMLEKMMMRGLGQQPKLVGRTILVVDTSGSMHQQISGKSDLTMLDAACALAVLAREICEDVVIYATAGSDSYRKHATMEIPGNLRGFELADYIAGREVSGKIGHGGIFFVQAMDYIARQEGVKNIGRVLVFTDEQDTSAYGRNFNPSLAKRLAPEGRNYIVNVGTNKNGINSAEWETITGFSEAVIDYIQESERVA